MSQLPDHPVGTGHMHAAAALTHWPGPLWLVCTALDRVPVPARALVIHRSWDAEGRTHISRSRPASDLRSALPAHVAPLSPGRRHKITHSWLVLPVSPAKSAWVWRRSQEPCPSHRPWIMLPGGPQVRQAVKAGSWGSQNLRSSSCQDL